jgi:hypothetical protein
LAELYLKLAILYIELNAFGRGELKSFKKRKKFADVQMQ